MRWSFGAFDDYSSHRSREYTWMAGGCGQALPTFADGNSLAFATEHQSSALLSIRVLMSKAMQSYQTQIVKIIVRVWRVHLLATSTVSND